jgi:hypothetical protein
MQKITSLSELKASIELLEIEQSADGVLLKEQLKNTYESLKPINLIKSTIKELTSVKDLKSDLIKTTLSMAAGYLSKKVIVGATDNPLKNTMGTLLQIGVTSLVSKNADTISAAILPTLKSIFKKDNSEE